MCVIVGKFKNKFCKKFLFDAQTKIMNELGTNALAYCDHFCK
jgi:hypothetical protein